jgi:hypothetical protein
MTEDVLDAPHQASQGGKKQKIKLVKFQKAGIAVDP